MEFVEVNFVFNMIKILPLTEGSELEHGVSSNELSEGWRLNEHQKLRR